MSQGVRGGRPSNTRVGRISQIDNSTLLKLQAGCNFINAEVARRRKHVILVAIAAFGVCIFLFSRYINDLRIFALAITATGAFFAYTQREVSKTYKHIVVNRVVKALGHGLTYKPESGFTKSDFVDMDLFEKQCEKLQAEDEVCGKKNTVTYSLHEAKATRTEGSGKNRRTVTIFKGLICRLDFNKNFQGHTVVVPDSESKVLGGLFGESETRRRKDIARMDSVEFEKFFSVYASDQQEARYLLTPKMMELIMEARMLLSADLRLSFHDNSVFLTVPQNKDRFEAHLFGSQVTPDSAAGDLVELVNLAENMVDALELETRIWSRV